jgi:hypothetical protein
MFDAREKKLHASFQNVACQLPKSCVRVQKKVAYQFPPKKHKFGRCFFNFRRALLVDVLFPPPLLVKPAVVQVRGLGLAFLNPDLKKVTFLPKYCMQTRFTVNYLFVALPRVS